MERSAFRFAVEASVYLSGKAAGKGAGRRLYAALFERLKDTGIRHIMAVIALPNDASVALHEKLGFKKVGEIPEIGYKFEIPQGATNNLTSWIAAAVGIAMTVQDIK